MSEDQVYRAVSPCFYMFRDINKKKDILEKSHTKNVRQTSSNK